jgi:hypothetical protein
VAQIGCKHRRGNSGPIAAPALPMDWADGRSLPKRGFSAISDIVLPFSLNMAHWRPFTLHSTQIAMWLSLGCHRPAAALRSGDLRNRRRDAAHRVLCNQQGAPHMGPMPASQPAVTRLAATPVPSHPSRRRSCTCTFSAGTKGGFRVLERTGALVPQVAHWPACWLCCFSLRSARLICLCGSVPPSLLRTHAVPRNRHTCRVCWSRQPNMAGGLRGRLS